MTAFVDDDGNYLDYSGADIGTTKQCANFFDFKIKGDVTATLKIPNNSHNRKVLAYYGPQQLGSPAFSRTPFNMVRDGNTISRGFVVIKDSDEDEINIFYISGNTNWFQSFQFNLKDIDFDDNLTVLQSDLTGRKDATSGLVFPLVDWWAMGSRRNTNYAKITNAWNTEENTFTEIHPCIFLHTLVEYSGQYGGCYIGGDLITDPLFKKILITPSGPDYYVPDTIVERTYARTQNGPFGSAGAGLYTYTLDPQLVRLQTLIEGRGQIDTTNYSWTAPKTGTYRVDVDFWFSVADTYAVEMWTNGALHSVVFNEAVSTQNKVGVIFANFSKGDVVQFYVNNTAAANYRLDLLSQNKFTNVSFQLEKTIKTPTANITSYSPVDTVPYILPNCVVPDMKAIDLIKFLANYFACVVTYDEFSNTIELNRMQAFKKEEAENWSDYYVSHRSRWETKVAKNNYIQFEDGTEQDIIAYNEQSNLSYGGGNIETSFDSLDERDLYKVPFSPSWDVRNKSYSKVFFPYINFYDVEYGESVTYSGVTNSGGLANFACTFNEAIGPFDVFYVKSNSGVYSGFAPLLSSGGTTNPTLLIDYVANDGGTIVKCTLSKTDGKPRLLVCQPGASISLIGGDDMTVLVGSTTGDTVTTSPLAWFDKPVVLAPIDSYNDSLAIDSDKNGNTIGERYFGPVKSAFNNPIIEAQMILPFSVFTRFNFGSYVFLKTKDLTGYFLVQKIENYRDALTPVKVELLYVD